LERKENGMIHSDYVGSPFTVPSVTVVLEAIRKIIRTTPAAANAARSTKY